ncbi:MAG: DNA repair exonuclease [Woeseia sp.]|nr:DNA repair exonuclease [Woeseia sp.]|tara:strand:+ start:1033 stop:2307 length:1275 start_codon:yes stop_codon:yes gene_type:complete
MSDFRFLHAADIHLDSPLRGLTGHEGNTVERIRSATRDALDRLVTFAIEENVAFLIIAGDLYDGDWRDYNTGLFFARQMGRLNAEGIAVYLLHGNHDAARQITKRLELPSNVHVFGSSKPETFRIDSLDVALHGQSFRQRDVTDNLSLTYPEPVSDFFNIGVLHTALAGRAGHESYAPCSSDDLVNKGYNYWALGHVHQAEVVHEHPHIVFPGNLQGRHSRETGAKGASLIKVEDGQVSALAAIPFDVVRWSFVTVDLKDTASFGAALGRIRDALEAAVTDEADGRLLVFRVALKGQTEIHDQLIASADQLLVEARASALGLGNEVAWVEKVVTSTTSLADPQAQLEREDAIGELHRMLPSARGDDELLAQLESDIGELVRKLPHEVRENNDDDLLKAALDGEYAQLMTDIMPFLTARLTTQEE